MSQALKPLIFVEPLSQTLQKLKEVIEENAESEGIEVYEVEDLAEMTQLVATIGQSLTLTSSPKKCALYLQSNRKIIKKIQSKTILLSPKTIPRKTLDKFMKVGLTECVVEPVNPKTLLYKVRLQLRSIIAKADDDEQEMTSRFSGEEGAQQEDTNQKMRAEKGVIMDDEAAPEVQRKEKKEVQEEVMDDPRKSKKKYQEEAIESYYKGSNKKREEEAIDYDEDKPKKKYQEEAIDGHYKGKLKKEEAPEEEEPKKKKKRLEFEDDTESLEDVRKRLELEASENYAREVEKDLVEEEQEEVKKKASSLVLEEEKEKKAKEKGEVEDLGGHYKGKLKQNQIDIEEDDYLDEKEDTPQEAIAKKKKRTKLELVEEEQDYLDEKEAQEEIESLEKKKNAKLELLDEEAPDYLDKKEAIEEEFEEKKKKIQLELEEAKEEKKKEKIVEPTQEKEREKRDAKADEIDGYLRGGAAKKVQLEDDGEDLYKDEQKELENEAKRKKKEALLLEDDEIEKDPLHGEKEYDDDYDKKKKAEKLLLDDEDSYGKKDSVRKEEQERERRKSAYKEEDQDGYSKGKGGAQKEEKGFGNRADARADQIKTHYSSKESLKHGEQDWDAKWEKKEKEQEDFEPLKREEKELIIEKDELGEQTIDYGQLKKEFEGISIDGVPNKKKKYATIDNVIKPKTYKKRVATVDGELEEMEFEEVIEEEVEVEGEQVFEPESLGMEISIEVLEFYFSKDVDSIKLCEFLNERVHKAFHGQMVFYSFAHSEFPEPLYNGVVHSQSGDEPLPLPEAELEGYSRSERKELEKDYKEELKEYQSAHKEAVEQWTSTYQSQLSDWREYKTPDWKDHTFQESENHFVFPFYEGVTLMGLAVFIPEEGFNPAQSEALEAVFEVARGIFVTEYHEKKGAGQIRQAQKKEEPKKKGGLFGKIFGKAG